MHTLLAHAGFSGAARREFKSIVSTLGAECLGDLLKGKTTYLVVSDAQQLTKQIEGSGSSAKIVRAVEWGIPLVDYQWLLDSASIGRLLDAEPYILQVLRGSSRSLMCIRSGLQ